MKRLLAFIIIVSVGWASYWWIGSSAANHAFERWFEDRQNEGWVANVDDINTRGFPSRFDTTLTTVSLADPETGLAYELPFLQIFALSYRPQHLIAVWPNSQSISTPYGQSAITTEDMRASLVLESTDSLALERTNLAISGVEVVLENGAQFGAQTVLAAIERVDADKHRYHFGLQSGGLYVPPPPGITLYSGDVLPDRFTRAHADVTIAFNGPWDRRALERSRPQPTHIEIKRAEAKWGELNLKLAGSLAVDETGRASGQIAIKAENWRDILALGVALGLLPETIAAPMEQGLSLLAGLSGNRESLDLPLSFDNGLVSLGPIPLGSAPRLVIR